MENDIKLCTFQVQTAPANYYDIFFHGAKAVTRPGLRSWRRRRRLSPRLAAVALTSQTPYTPCTILTRSLTSRCDNISAFCCLSFSKCFRCLHRFLSKLFGGGSTRRQGGGFGNGGFTSTSTSLVAVPADNGVRCTYNVGTA